jgi:hypothetical protein
VPNAFDGALDDARAAIVARMTASRDRARAELAAAARLRRDVDEAAPDPPRAVREILAEELSTGGAHAEALARHYLDLMPAMRVAQLDAADGLAAKFFHAPLDWEALPRLAGALARLFAHLPDGATLAGARTAAELHARSPTIAALFSRTAYGGFMPLLYGYPADLAHFARALRDDDVQPLNTVIDRYFAAPLIHELTHFGRARDVLSLYLDECIAAWLGVTVMPEFAFPAPGDDNALYATPWLAQVGQAIARVAGSAALVAAHAGVVAWRDALPPGLADIYTRFGRDDYRATRPLHLLSDSYAPERWMKLAFMAAANMLDGAALDGAALDGGALPPWSAIAAPAESPVDRDVVRDGLRAMCLRNYVVEQSWRVASRVPSSPITIDCDACTITTATQPDSIDAVAPRYLLPPSIAARLRRDGHGRVTVTLARLDDVDDVAEKICAGRF